MSVLGDPDPHLTFGKKLRNNSWGLVLLLCATAGLGFAILYSVAGGSVDPWVTRQAARFAIGFTLMMGVAFVDIRFWLKAAYPFYAISLVMLVGVELVGVTGQGAQRWVDLGIFNLQPSEMMKLALVMVLARYFHGLAQDEIGKLRWLIVPTFLTVVPVILVLREPDLGTAMLLLAAAGMVVWLAGARWWLFALILIAAIASIPIGWEYMHGYQQERILTFLNPERDPLGAGYHIMQSKIALGSGGIWGKGFLFGTQSQLSFLPEKQTDFIFTTLAEELGLAGGLMLLALYTVIISIGFGIAFRSLNQFSRLLALGITCTFFLYVFINVAMVMGLVPVVGVPLPLISYGGTAMVTIMLGFGLVLSVSIHRDVPIPRKPGLDAP
jgi:rod shape determining protein RodA